MEQSICNTTKFVKFNPCGDALIPGLPNDMALECLVRVPITSHPNLQLVSHNWKSTVSHPSFGFLRSRAAAAEHLVFLIQPLSPLPSPSGVFKGQELDGADDKEMGNQQSPLLYNLNVYNSTHQEWRNLANITIPTFAQCVALPKAGMVIVLGGWDPATLEPVPRVLVIDLARGIWREGSPMPTARSFFASAAVGSSAVYVAGGHDGQKNALRTAEVYDVETDQWRALPPMAEERDESQGLLLSSNDSKFWVISGYGTESQGRFRSDAEVYDPETNTWSQIDGVWPYQGHTPKSTVVAVSNHQQRWWSMIGGEFKEFNFEDKVWKTLTLGSIPKSVTGSSSISLVDMGDDRMLLMGNGGKCEKECKNDACGGEGVFMLEKSENKDGINWRWKHVHAPNRFLGFPFSASQFFI